MRGVIVAAQRRPSSRRFGGNGQHSPTRESAGRTGAKSMTAANILDSDESGDDLDLDLDIVQVDRPRDGLETFATLLFSRVAPEDLLVHKPRELSDLAASAWEFLANRTPGKP